MFRECIAVQLRYILLLINVCLRCLIRPHSNPFMCLSDTYCPFFSPLRVLFLHLLIELMQPSVLCLIATHAFVPERRKLLLTAQRGILLLDTVLSGINSLSDPSERFSGSMLYVPRCFLQFLVLRLQHSLFLDAIREIFVELPPISLQISNLLLFRTDKGLVLY